MKNWYLLCSYSKYPWPPHRRLIVRIESNASFSVTLSKQGTHYYLLYCQHLNKSSSSAFRPALPNLWLLLVIIIIIKDIEKKLTVKCRWCFGRFSSHAWRSMNSSRFSVDSRSTCPSGVDRLTIVLSTDASIAMSLAFSRNAGSDSNLEFHSASLFCT